MAPRPRQPATGNDVIVRPLDADRWPDLERLFGPRGAQAGCWCMWWRLSARDFTASTPDARRRLMAQRASEHPAAGLLAYDNDEPVGWVAAAPRTEFTRLDRSPIVVRDQSRPGDWAITCFYVRLDRRGQGLASVLLDAVIAAAEAAGARHVEAYPIAATNNHPAADLFPGTLNLFLRAGFTEVGRRRGRPTVRRSLTDGKQR